MLQLNQEARRYSDLSFEDIALPFVTPRLCDLGQPYHWSLKALMEYVGWRDVHSALRYVDVNEVFGDWRREAGES